MECSLEVYVCTTKLQACANLNQVAAAKDELERKGATTIVLVARSCLPSKFSMNTQKKGPVS